MLARRNDNWGLFHPWRTVNDLHKEFISLFDELSEGFNRFRASYPKINLNEGDKDIVVQMALPGYSADNIEIEVVSNFLMVRAERTQPKLGKGERLLHQERTFGKVEESIKLPAKVKSPKVKAKLADGVLTITMPKMEAEKAQKILINK
ncbi:MAG: Hsp20/alpha crystallin family protein [Victivallaceae bacterium]|nr:Hsp20/alpha crystallin family protein [Victivallaceae bacterium]